MKKDKIKNYVKILDEFLDSFSDLKYLIIDITL